MTKVTLEIPDNELEFFTTVANKFNYYIEIEDEIGEIPMEVQKIMIERKKNTKIEDMISWDTIREEIRKDYGI
jgi:hypothetical protein